MRERVRASRTRSLIRWVREGRRDRFFNQLWEIDPLFKPCAAAVFGLVRVDALPPRERARIYTRVATYPRAKLLRDLTGAEVRPGTLHLLAKADYELFQESDWRALLNACNDNEIRRELQQLDHFSPVLIRQIESVPELVRCAAVFNVLNSLAVSNEHWRQLSDSLQDAPLDIHKPAAVRAKKVHSVGSFWDFFFEYVECGWKPFPLPESFFSSPALTPLATAKEMKREGLTMKNCMGQLVRGVLSGWDAYFHWNGSVPASVQLIRAGDRWNVGQIAAKDDEPVDQSETAKILKVAQRLIDQAAGNTGVDRDPCEAAIDSVREHAAAVFTSKVIQRIARQLVLIRGKSLPDSGSFCAIEGKNGYVQFMADVGDGKRYWCEIQSHQFVPETEKWLTDSAVSLIMACGFRWPDEEQNFGRYFWVKTDDEVVKLAQFALGILSRIFDQTPRMRLKLETKIAERSS